MPNLQANVDCSTPYGVKYSTVPAVMEMRQKLIMHCIACNQKKPACLTRYVIMAVTADNHLSRLQRSEATVRL